MSRVNSCAFFLGAIIYEDQLMDDSKLLDFNLEDLICETLNALERSSPLKDQSHKQSSPS